MIVKNIEKKDAKTADFQVEIDPAEFEAAVNKAYQKNKGSINIAGFRPGKAPRTVIEGMYGKDVFYQDAIDALGPDAFGFGYDNCGLKIIGKPSISNIDLSDENVLTLTFTVELYPEVVLGEYKNLSAEKMSAEVTDEMVDRELQATLKRNARMVDVDRPAEAGDTANIDFDGFLDGVRFDGGMAEGYRLELGSGSFVPGFEDQVIGMQIGEVKDIAITFPENYAEELAGKDVTFTVRLNGLTVRELDELNDEFIQDVSEFNTVEEYTADVKANLERSVNEQAENQFRADIFAKACENMTVEVPDIMIDAKVAEMLRNYASNFGIDTAEASMDDIIKQMGIDEDAMNNAIRPSAISQVKNDILLDAVVEAEGITMSDDDLNAYLEKVSESVSAKPEDILKYFGKEFIQSEYLREKATEAIMSSTTVLPAAEPAEDKAE